MGNQAIKTISIYQHEGHYTIFGLGEDNKMYRWMSGKWVAVP